MVSIMTGARVRLAAALLAVGLAPGAAEAQPAVVEGAVTDATGLALPGVTVDARPAGGGAVRATVTGADGRFAIPDLPPGSYVVTFSLTGFRTVVRDGVAAGAGAAAELAVEMPVQLEDRVVVVGSRARPRSATESAVPIDAIPWEDFAGQGDTDVGDQLRTLAPSCNVSPQPTGDAARLIRPATLRGLAPDHTLVLVNGKRRHRGAVITWIGNDVADGAQGPDISTPPNAASSSATAPLDSGIPRASSSPALSKSSCDSMSSVARDLRRELIAHGAPRVAPRPGEASANVEAPA